MRRQLVTEKGVPIKRSFQKKKEKDLRKLNSGVHGSKKNIRGGKEAERQDSNDGEGTSQRERTRLVPSFQQGN